MSDSVNVVCPRCNAVNRVPGARLAAGPKCGKCKERLFTGQPVELSDTEFEKHLRRNDIPLVVDFWAPWCGPCKMIAPLIQEIADEYINKAKICKLNTDDARDSAMEFGISAIPTIILFKDGQVQQKWVGLTSKKDLAAAIDELL